MTENLQVSPRYVRPFLLERWGPAISEVVPLESGAWSRAYSFRHDGARYVIRWSDVLENFERDALAASFHRSGLPIPPIMEIDRGMDGYYAISPFVAGTYLEALPSPALKAALPSTLGMFEALRSIDLSESTGFGHWDGAGQGGHGSWKDFLLAVNTEQEGSLIHGWRANLESSALGTDSFEQLYDRLTAVVQQCPEDRHLVHSDLLNRNVLVKGNEISAVLDWGSSLFGDPLYDIAWFAFYQPWFPNFNDVDLANRLMEHFLADRATNKRDIDARMIAYRLHIGLDSIAYNASRQNWKNAQEAADYTLRTAS